MGLVCSSGSLVKSMYTVILSCSCSAGKRSCFWFRTVPEEPMTTDNLQSTRNPRSSSSLVPSPDHLLYSLFPSWYLSRTTYNGFVSVGCKYNQVNSHFHCIREGCQFSFLLKHQMTSHARKHMRRMLGKNFDRVPTQVTHWLNCRSACSVGPFGCLVQNCFSTKTLVPKLLRIYVCIGGCNWDIRVHPR